MTTYNGAGDVAADTRKYGPRRFVFQPGGTAEGNVYTDFSLLYADLAATSGMKEIVLDDTFTTPITIPAGTYDLTGTRLGTGDIRTPNIIGTGYRVVVVEFASGVTITNLCDIQNIAVLHTVAESPIQYDSGGTVGCYISGSFLLSMPGSNPLIQVSGGTTVYFRVLGNTQLGASNNTTIEMLGADTIEFHLQNNSTVPDDCIAGPLASTISEIFTDSSSSFHSSQFLFLGAAGVPNPNRTSNARRVEAEGPFVHSASTDVEGVLGDFDAVLGSGGFTAETNAVYVAATGNDSNSGLIRNEPKLTLASALTAAIALTPGSNNLIDIRVLDAADYNVTAPLILSPFISIDAPMATFYCGGNPIGLADHSRIRAFKVTGSGIPIACVQGGKSWIDVDYIESTASVGVYVGAPGINVEVHLRIGRIIAGGDAGIEVAAGSSGVELYGSVAYIAVTVGRGVYIRPGTTPELGLKIGRIYGFAAGTKGVHLSGSPSIPVGGIYVGETYVQGNAFEADAGLTLNATCGFVSGTGAQSGGAGTVNLCVEYNPGVPPDWIPPLPTNTKEALDRIASALVILLGGPIP